MADKPLSASTTSATCSNNKALINFKFASLSSTANTFIGNILPVGECKVSCSAVVSITGCKTLLKVIGDSGLLIQLMAPLAINASCKLGEVLFKAKCILLENGCNCAIVFFNSLNAVDVWLWPIST